MLTLNENELLKIEGGKKKSLIGIDDLYDGAKHIYKDLRDHGYDNAKDFAKGFYKGITSIIIFIITFFIILKIPLSKTQN
ncbi:hypothetical protein [Clostridium weizhouense]|uniref:Bacteriocin-type signal sequence n=1 Tax=Clostridium weizhouense TaxID=2859781 RepID=A0ABS7AQ13_9CLOT|nr:hypothetical protein [Clostridium weizhouense]MBW6410751.1 hypothetical protein [Clostridium weizhouense]